MHIHILAIGGLATASLAKELKKQGHQVSGSDQNNIFPPVTDILREANLKINNTPISSAIDLAIIGPAYDYFTNTRNEFKQIKKLKIPYISSTQYIAQNIAKENSIIIAGSYGKTTISSLVSWIFFIAKKDPSYMFAGLSIKSFDSVHISNSSYSILEGDEAVNGLDTQAKFLYYPLKYLLLTSADWEHKEAYPTSNANFNSFKKLVLNIPQNGLLVINHAGIDTKKLAYYSKSKVVSYNSKNADYQIVRTTADKSKIILHLNTPSGKINLRTGLIGSFNHQNILGAVALCFELGLDKNIVIQAIESYLGIKRRLEVIPQKSHLVFIDDMAQSAPRIMAALQAISQHYPTRNLKVFLEPHASFLQYKSGLVGLRQALKPSSEIILAKINFRSNMAKNNRATYKDYQNEIGPHLHYLPLYDQVLSYYKDTLNPNDVLVHFSSGGLEGMNTFNSIIKHYNKNK